MLDRDGDVLVDGQTLVNVRYLELASNTFPSDFVNRQVRDRLGHEVDLAGRRLLLAGYEIEERRLAGSVRSDEATQLT